MTKSQYRQRQSQLLTGYGAICLDRIGNYAIVSVEAMPGKWVEVIREQIDGNFHHIVEPVGIEEIFLNHGIDPSANRQKGTHESTPL